ncbi:hypothetical protein Mal4_17470 [Maioricimonas rarisocia]|uniref:Uncharacterized protein n=1 Tax=Maioricimonas rarisocia TaxID=2528026 RepID=A0A517Z4R1_9PLAN|nr:hypothetical protein [Maioricimonas rarisocia]QDU37435.1 hypothetical protein Mal4_17470 [Maioricimonas rarisocia]
MWCAHCQTDVAIEVSADGQSLLCTGCGEEIRRVVAPSLHPDTRSARELLERWSSEELLRPDATAGSQRSRDADDRVPPPRTPERTPPRHESEPVEDSRGPARAHDEPPPRRSQPKFRIDSAHERVSEPSPRRPAARPRTRVALDEELPPGMRAHYAHEEVPAPHFKVQRPTRTATEEPGRSEAFWGQLLAYGGVAVLTIGTCLVLLGYFGGQPTYAPTGWLITTAGQMLLFLGVVTLVSGGMQQTAHEVAQRVDYLDGRMVRIEDSTQELLRGPQFNRHRDRRTGAADDDTAGSYT